MISGTPAAVEAIKERLEPAFETFEENVRQGRRLFVEGRHAAEDAVAAASLQFRRRPMIAVVAAVATGALLGSVLGFVLGSRCRKS